MPDTFLNMSIICKKATDIFVNFVSCCFAQCIDYLYEFSYLVIMMLYIYNHNIMKKRRIWFLPFFLYPLDLFHFPCCSKNPSTNLNRNIENVVVTAIVYLIELDGQTPLLKTVHTWVMNIEKSSCNYPCALFPTY